MKMYKSSLALIITLFIQLGFFTLGEADAAFGQMKTETVQFKTMEWKSKNLGKSTLSALPINSTILEKGIDIETPHEEPPVPIGGYEAINENLEYPELARKAGLEGSVIIGVLIDEQGNPIRTEVRKGERFSGFEKAAQRALMAVKWTPAKQGDRAVQVWVWVPVYFVKWK